MGYAPISCMSSSPFLSGVAEAEVWSSAQWAGLTSALLRDGRLPLESDRSRFCYKWPFLFCFCKTRWIWYCRFWRRFIWRAVNKDGDIIWHINSLDNPQSSFTLLILLNYERFVIHVCVRYECYLLWHVFGSAGKASPVIFQNLWFVFLFFLVVFFIPSVRLIWLCSAFTRQTSIWESKELLLL